jgi:uncharacterized protein (DUF1501 family)
MNDSVNTNLQDKHRLSRRAFIKSTVAGWVLMQSMGSSVLAQSLQSSNSKKKIVWVMLRGAMDSLSCVIPAADPHLTEHRASLVTAIADKALPLDKGFTLHPALKNCYQWYKNKEFSPVVAVASGYRARSHFDAQDQMESGMDNTDYESGWLARAVAAFSGEGLAISQTVPIALRGTKSSQTWFPSHFAPVDDDLLSRLKALCQQDKEFTQLLEKAVSNRDNLAMSENGKAKPDFSYLAQHCGELLSRDDSANCAMLELGGWDTHNNQSARLNRQLGILDSGLGELKNALGNVWKDTVVIVTTEFGRTVKENGTKGTDHGTGSAMFLLGGAVKGQQVLGEWPGLASKNLYQNRDLMPTSDVRSWMATILHQHWGLSLNQLKQVFPDVLPVAQALVKST